MLSFYTSASDRIEPTTIELDILSIFPTCINVFTTKQNHYHFYNVQHVTKIGLYFTIDSVVMMEINGIHEILLCFMKSNLLKKLTINYDQRQFGLPHSAVVLGYPCSAPLPPTPHPHSSGNLLVLLLF